MKRAKKRLLITIGTLVGISIVTAAIGVFIRGYRPDWQAGQLRPTGLLAATSVPKGAQVWIDGKLKTATDQSISLVPDQYQVKIKKPGYSPWQKDITINKEVVAETNARLFPTNPSLKALSFTGSIRPSLSPDGTKMIYFVPVAPNTASPTPTPTATPTTNIQEKPTVGIWLIDLTERPLGKSFQPRLLVQTQKDFPFQKAEINWAPSSQEFLLTFPYEEDAVNLFIKTEQTYDFTAPPFLGKTVAEVEEITTNWEEQKERQQQQLMKKLPEKFANTVEESGQNITFSPDEGKLLYQVNHRLELPNQYLQSEVVGASTQPETRQLQADQWYVYDIKEDKNFAIDQTGSIEKITWFPSSYHLLFTQEEKVKIIECDGNNKTTIYSGPFEDSLVFPFPSGEQLLIFTSLNNSQQDLPNLYSISLE